jgi:hypothetical protein
MTSGESELLSMMLREVLSMRAELGEIRSLILEQRPIKPLELKRFDKRLAHLLDQMGPRLGDAVWSVASLRAAVLETGDVALARALDACGSAKALGRLLVKHVGQDVAGWTVLRLSPPQVKPATFKVGVSGVDAGVGVGGGMKLPGNRQQPVGLRCTKRNRS